MKQVEPFIEIRDALSLRNINIWSIEEKCGSRSHPEKFLDLIKAGNTLAKNQSGRTKFRSLRKGLPNCSEHPPTKPGDPWGTAEDARLREFLDTSQIQDKFLLETVRATGILIRWQKLQEEEYPLRTPNELKRRYRMIKRYS
jgi:hypothetical protein